MFILSTVWKRLNCIWPVKIASSILLGSCYSTIERFMRGSAVSGQGARLNGLFQFGLEKSWRLAYLGIVDGRGNEHHLEYNAKSSSDQSQAQDIGDQLRKVSKMWAESGEPCGPPPHGVYTEYYDLSHGGADILFPHSPLPPPCSLPILPVSFFSITITKITK
jgi:hypothetical protein